MKDVVVISLGGSVISPDKPDVAFLKSFKNTIKRYSKEKLFIIVAGGGKPCRVYQEALWGIASPSREDLDLMGIAATRFNAQLLRLAFSEEAYAEILTDPTSKVATSKRIILAGGWKPGWSTDYVAVVLAKTYGASALINISDIDYIYDSDPKLNPNAKRLEHISWAEMKGIVGTEWTPGMNAPFDPVATELAAKNSLRLIMVGADCGNFEKILNYKFGPDEEPCSIYFKGTIVN